MCLEFLRIVDHTERPLHIQLLRRIRQRVQEIRERRRRKREEELFPDVMEPIDPNDPTFFEQNGSDELLNLDSLLGMSPLYNGVDLIGRASRQLFLSHIENQPSVHDIFFPNHDKDRNEDKIDPSWFDFDRFAAVYTCQAITKCKDSYRIYTMLDEEKTDELVSDYFTSPDWKKIGFALYTLLFPDLVRDRDTLIPFRAYMEDDGRYWASKIYEKIRDSQWLYSLMRPVVEGKCTEQEYNRDMNTLFVKLHLLDPTVVFPAFNHLRKTLPNLNLELVTTNYLGEPLPWTLVKEEVEAAINKPTFPRNAPRISMDQYELYYGVQVTEFVMTEPRELGLWTGKYADNRKMATFKDRCVVM